MIAWFMKQTKWTKIVLVGVTVFVIMAIAGVGNAPKETTKSAPAAANKTAAPAKTSASTTPATSTAHPLSPAERVKTAAASVLSDRLKDSAFDAASGNATVQFQISENLTSGMMVDGAREDSVEVSKAILAAAPEVKQVLIGVYGDAKDAYGNTTNEQVIKITLIRATAEKINVSGMDWEKFPSIADSYKELVNF